MSCQFCGHIPHDIMCPNFDSQPMGQCKQCHTILLFNNNYIIDKDDNKFCSEWCAVKYHGIIEKEWTEDDRDYQR
jgi:hypothetical protein